MDGINGIATGTATLSALFLSLFFSYLFPVSMCLVALALVAGALGFLPFNYPKARIFLGDVGSQAIGFLLATISLFAMSYAPHHISLFTILLLFMPFCFDTALTMIRRAIARENIFQAHRTHLYQLLNRLGWSQTQITLLYLALTCVGGFTASMSLKLPLTDHIYLLAITLLFYAAFGYIVIKRAQQQSLI